MTLARSVVVPGMTNEYNAFADLLDMLSADQWETPSRCSGWRVADVAAHVVGQLSDVTAFRLEGLGTPDVTARQVDERRGSTADELAEELRSTTKTAADLVESFDDAAFASEGPQGNGQTLGFGLEALWFDTYLHADDIRVALGQATTERVWTRAIRIAHLTSSLAAGVDTGNHPAHGTGRILRLGRWQHSAHHGRPDAIHSGVDRSCGSRHHGS